MSAAEATSRYLIEDNVPLPPKAAGRRTTLANTLRAMKPGQSVLIADRPYNSITGQAGSATKKTGHRFVTRKVDGGIRVWCFAAEVRS